MKKKSDKKISLIGLIFIIGLAAILIGEAVFLLSTGERRHRMEEIARKIFEKPIRIIMQAHAKKAPRSSLIKAQDEILVDDFDIGLTSGLAKGRRNRLGSYQGTFSMRPSFAVITKSSEIRRGEKGQSLVIDYKSESGWCGWYTLLNDIDVSRYNTLSFWVRGEKGGENFDIGLSDSRMQSLEMDAFFLGSVTSFIPGGFITKEWREVKVPLTRAASEINLSKMGSLVFWFKYGGESRIYVDDVKVKNDSEISKIEEYNAPQSEKDLLHPRALWVWKIDPVNSVRQRAELFNLCQRSNISALYLFFPEFSETPSGSYFKSLSELLKESHKLGIRVEALTGNPVWSLAENHQLLLNWIKFFLEYNKERPVEERIDGISLDVEPYLTAEWEKDRERIKRDYIELLRKCRELINSYSQEFRLGVAIPFFYDKEDDGKFERSILDYVDYLALMDYYDTAKDIIEHAKFHIALAKELNKKVIIGVETQDLVAMRQGKRRNTFIEEGWEEMERRLNKVKEEFLFEPSFEGFAIHHYDSYKLMTRGRNFPTRERPADVYTIQAKRRAGDIKIDGKLDDWDLSRPYETIDNKYIVYGKGACKGTEDLCYRSYILWDEEALYFAIDVIDNKFIQEKAGSDMWEGDHVELWLDTDLSADINEAVNSEDDFQIGLSPGNFSNLPAEAYIWTPTLPDDLNYKELIKVASSRTAQGYIVEARIPKEVLFYYQTASGPDKFLSLHQGFKMGIMIDVGDTDDLANPQKALMSTSVNRVWGDPTTFGVLELE